MDSVCEVSKGSATICTLGVCFHAKLFPLKNTSAWFISSYTFSSGLLPFAAAATAASESRRTMSMGLWFILHQI